MVEKAKLQGRNADQLLPGPGAQRKALTREGHTGPFWGDGNLLLHYFSGACVYLCQNSSNCTLKIGNLYSYSVYTELYYVYYTANLKTNTFKAASWMPYKVTSSFGEIIIFKLWEHGFNKILAVICFYAEPVYNFDPSNVCKGYGKWLAYLNISLHFCFLFTSLPNLEKLIEGLKSPDTSLLLPDLLPMTDPFGSTSDAVIGKVILFVSSVVHKMCVCFKNGNPLVNSSLLNNPAEE